MNNRFTFIVPYTVVNLRQRNIIPKESKALDVTPTKFKAGQVQSGLMILNEEGSSPYLGCPQATLSKKIEGQKNYLLNYTFRPLKICLLHFLSNSNVNCVKSLGPFLLLC